MARLDLKKSLLLGDVFLAETLSFEAKELIKNLGGTIKIGRIIEKISKADVFKASLKELEKAPKKSKFNFGISVYGKININTYKLGLELKTILKKAGVSCRLVTSRDKNLSSVVVEQNKLVSSGRELVFIADGKNIWFGVTEAVQPFKELSHRDFGRPARDDKSGMLPPKLAQMMINLSKGKLNEILLDPFCGSGTILTEAMLMGYEKIIGTDISEKAISDSQKNIDWIKREFPNFSQVEVKALDAKNVSKEFKANSVGAIITETYLGPQRGKFDIKKVTADLHRLYSQVLEECLIILKPGHRIVMVLPIFRHERQQLSLQAPNGMKKIQSFIYGRENQNVWREIVIFEK